MCNYRNDRKVMQKQWLDFIQQEVAKDYMIELKSFLDSERATKKVFPDSNSTFNHMAFCPYDRLKVVIIGDAPYNQDINDGLAFSARTNIAPEETKNLLYEAFRDYFKAWDTSAEVKHKLFPTNQLTEWAKQGVLLMNNVYTCTENDRFSHMAKGWHTFNDTLMDFLNQYHLPLVFVNKSKYDYRGRIQKKHLYLTSEETKWCTLANDFIRKRNVPATEQYHQLKINWTTKACNV